MSSLCLLAAMATAPDARAQGYLTTTYGWDHGSGAQANGYATFYNPAALGGTKGTTITGDVTVIYRYLSYRRTTDALSPSTPALLNDPAYVAANTGKNSLSNVIPLPYIGINTDFGTQNFRAGYAIYTPFGGQENWGRHADVPGAPGSGDGPQRWADTSARLLMIYNTFAAAYRFPEAGLSIGASVSPVISSISLTRAKNVDGSDDTMLNGNLVEGRSYVNASGVQLAASAGVYYEATPDIRLGLSYLSQPGFGDMRLHGTLKSQFGTTQETDTSIDFIQQFPDQIRLAGAWRVSPKLELRGNFDYIRWSVLKKQCVVERGASCDVADDGLRLGPGTDGSKVQLNIPRNWHDAVAFRVGPGYWISDDVELFGSYQMSFSPVPVSTLDPTTFDSTRLYFAFGAKFAVTPKLSLAANYTHIVFLPVDTKGQSDVNITAHPASSANGSDYNVSRSPSANGKYNSTVGFLNLNAAYTF